MENTKMNANGDIILCYKLDDILFYSAERARAKFRELGIEIGTPMRHLLNHRIWIVDVSHLKHGHIAHIVMPFNMVIQRSCYSEDPNAIATENDPIVYIWYMGDIRGHEEEVRNEIERMGCNIHRIREGLYQTGFETVSDTILEEQLEPGVSRLSVHLVY